MTQSFFIELYITICCYSEDILEHRKLDIEEQKIELERERFAHEERMDERKIDLDQMKTEQDAEAFDKRINLETAQMEKTFVQQKKETESKEKVALLQIFTSKPVLILVSALFYF